KWLFYNEFCQQPPDFFSCYATKPTGIQFLIKNVAVAHNQFSWIPVSGHWDDTIGGYLDDRGGRLLGS
ncbi:hypothetical protein OZD61_02185, partial [Wolbachia endosymbiont of Drosophila bocki]|nr:hypothetical protein [Wolbachia endosymbiont of Drosophila bocki]